jgi:pimeloyl-ACP methyl ester carboxylesterase
MKQLVLIHGALGSGDEFNDLLPYLEKHFHVYVYEIPGHGSKRDELIQFDLESITLDLKNYLSAIGNSYIFGFSLGGYLAIHLSSLHPENILGIVTLGTKFEWSPEIAEREIKSLDSSFLREKAPPFYAYLIKLHGEHIEPLLTSTAKFMVELGKTPPLSPRSVEKINIPIHITRGGKDKMVSGEESHVISNAIVHSTYFEIPSFIHPLGFLKPKHLAQHIIVQVNALDYKHAMTKHGRISYKEIGIPSSDEEPLLLFLHEALGSIAQWQDFPEKLSEKLGLASLVPEMLGYGFSAETKENRDANYLHQFAWEHIPAFLDALNITNKLLIVGHSDGGSEALLFASKFPERVAGIVAMAAHIENEPETKAGIHPAIEAFEQGKLTGLEIYHGARTAAVFNAWSQTWLGTSFQNWNLEKDLRKCDFPALIIQGVDDQYGTAEQVHKIVNCLGQKAVSCFIPSCGHSPHHEQQALVLEKIEVWNKL